MLKYILLVLLACCTFIAQAQTPNILLIIADDLGTDALNGYTTQTVKPNTPTLDSLRGIGITFTNAWASPECTPTRSNIMSGKYGTKTGVLSVPGNLDTSHISVLKRLKTDANDVYAKAVIGKWHISRPVDVQHPYQHGADYYMGFMEGFPDDYFSWQKTENNVTALANSYVTTTLTDRAISWTSQQTKPWLLWLAHAAPHSPFHEPPTAMYTIANATTDTRKYLAMVESIDYETNRLLSSMTTAERNNTLIIFIGDNGTPNNLLRDYPSGHGKSTVYEGGVRVPFIIAGNGVSRAGVQETALVHVADIYATILDIAGAEIAGGWYNSLSFKHLLTNSTKPTRDYNYAEVERNGVYSWAIRNVQYKLIDLGTGIQEYYDLLADPLEENQLNQESLTTEQAKVLADLKIEVSTIQTDWSCRDHIKNGDETGIDCGGSSCTPCKLNADELAQQSIKIYPNPSGGVVHIESEKNLKKIEVLDYLGRQIHSRDNLETTQISLDLSEYTSPVYILRITTTAGTFAIKMMKN